MGGLDERLIRSCLQTGPRSTHQLTRVPQRIHAWSDEDELVGCNGIGGWLG